MKDGIQRKYEVRRTNGSSEPGGKHEHCAYFVLDLEHDKHAIDALLAYARSCERELPELADDLRRIVNAEADKQFARCNCREVGCAHSLGQALVEGPSDTAHRLMNKGPSV